MVMLKRSGLRPVPTNERLNRTVMSTFSDLGTNVHFVNLDSEFSIYN